MNYSMGFYGIGSGMNEVVKSASIKMIDVEKGKWLLIITVADGGDSVPVTAKKFANALKEKIEAR